MDEGNFAPTSGRMWDYSRDLITHWKHFADPAFAFEFDYPAESDSGERVALVRHRHPHGEAVHLSTEDGEVYFELDRSNGRSAAAGLGRLEGDVLDRFPNAWFGELESTTICGEPAVSVRFRFGDRIRWAIFTERALPSHRVILDPRSSTNLQMLGSLTPRSAV